jgi:hypothetical protein
MHFSRLTFLFCDQVLQKLTWALALVAQHGIALVAVRPVRESRFTMPGESRRV